MCSSLLQPEPVEDTLHRRKPRYFPGELTRHERPDLLLVNLSQGSVFFEQSLLRLDQTLPQLDGGDITFTRMIRHYQNHVVLGFHRTSTLLHLLFSAQPRLYPLFVYSMPSILKSVKNGRRFAFARLDHLHCERSPSSLFACTQVALDGFAGSICHRESQTARYEWPLSAVTVLFPSVKA
jgi:hypothetical protein